MRWCWPARSDGSGQRCNGDIPHFVVTNGDGSEGLRWRRRAVRSPGKRGRVRVGALRLPTADSLCDLKVARASKISGRKFSAAARRKRTAFRSAEMAALRCNAAARRALPPRRAPFGRKESPPWAGVPPDAVRPRLPGDRTARLRRHDPQLRSRLSSHRGVSPRVEKIARLGVLVLAEPWSRALFSQQRRKWGRAALASTRGPCGVGGRAFRGLTRSATEWSAASRKPLRAAALHLSAAISADVKARRLPTSDRRKFPSAEIFEARATLREQSGSTLGRRDLRLSPSPFARNRGLSPFSSPPSRRSARTGTPAPRTPGTARPETARERRACEKC